jgi:hypothetical protein
MEDKQNVYLGDGVYTSFNGYHIMIAVNHHGNHVVAIEPDVLIGLIKYGKQVGVLTDELIKEEILK